MNIELQINNTADPKARYVSWSPSPCRIRVTNPSGAASPTVDVQIIGTAVADGGAVVFRKDAAGAFSESLTLPIPVNGTSVSFFVAGSKIGIGGESIAGLGVASTVAGSLLSALNVKRSRRDEIQEFGL